MLANTLNTNEIKNAAGTEKEFGRLSSGERTTEFGLLTETPNSKHRLGIKHSEVGVGVALRRRSVLRFDLTGQGAVDTTKSITTSAYVVLDCPIGNSTSYDAAKEVLANLMSFLATTGAATTVLFDCTGNGASTLINGSL